MKKKLLSLLMALCLVVTLLPVNALAADDSADAETDLVEGSAEESAKSLMEVPAATTDETVWDGTTVDTTWYNTSEKEFTLDSAADLAGLAKLVNEGNTFSGKTIKLGANIDLNNHEWTPIGKSGANFQGTFDGAKADGTGNHTISNLAIDQPTKSDMGLFGFTTGGQVKNFTLHNAKVTGYLDVGAVAGTPYTSEYSNIDVTGLIQVEGFSYVGGALGKNAYANITDVDVTGVDGSYVKAESGIYRTYLGGLVGFMGEGNITVSNCNVKIDVTGSTCDVGGILGILHYGNTMTGCTYEGSLTLTNPDEEDGAEFGALTGTVMNSTSKATITGCTATVTKAMSGERDVTNSITPHGDFYYDIATGNGGDVEISATVNETPVTVDNNVAKVGENGYKNLNDAINAANGTAGDDTVTVTITKSGTYAPFTITRANVTVQAAEGVNATIKVSDDTMKTTQKGVTLKNLAFVTENGSTIVTVKSPGV